MTPILAFSHLRWDFVYQRPQQILSRLASRRKIFYLEEPITGASRVALHVESPVANVTVLRPQVTGTAHGFHEEHGPALNGLVRNFLQQHGSGDCLHWLYTPMALPLSASLNGRATIYDCMDDLASFKGAAAEMRRREQRLLSSADLVLTGGRSLYEARRGSNPNLHCLPSSVEIEHFQRSISDHPSQAGIPHPRLGFYGVIDERLDVALIAALADSHPEWQVIMVGPVAKIDPAILPERPNLHWLGQRSFAELPAHLAGWDISLMPFAVNDATRFISPTKTLEYLAAKIPCVSTCVKDVVTAYQGVVAIAASQAAFVAECERILQWTDSERMAFAALATRTVAATSWDSTVSRIENLLSQLEPVVSAA